MRTAVVTLFLSLCLSFSLDDTFVYAQAEAPQTITIDAHAPSHPFPHFWDQMFGSGRAVLALRENYLDDLKEVHDDIGMRYVRFHAIFHDENGVYDEDKNGKPVYDVSPYLEREFAFGVALRLFHVMTPRS